MSERVQCIWWPLTSFHSPKQQQLVAVSTVECTASAAIAELRVNAAATNLHTAIATLATIAE